MYLSVLTLLPCTAYLLMVNKVQNCLAILLLLYLISKNLFLDLCAVNSWMKVYSPSSTNLPSVGSYEVHHNNPMSPYPTPPNSHNSQGRGLSNTSVASQLFSYIFYCLFFVGYYYVICFATATANNRINLPKPSNKL